MPGDLTVADQLVVAAADLDSPSGSIFTAEELVVAAWSAFPATFGLRGFLDETGKPLHPDSNRVFAEMMGSKGVRRRGYLEKVGNKRYRLTQAGRDRAAELRSADSSSSSKLALDRATLDAFRRLTASRAALKAGDGRVSDLTFHDACTFWGISPRSSANELRSRLANVSGVLDAVGHATEHEKPLSLRSGGVVLSAEDVDVLRKLSDRMQELFSTELDFIWRRIDER